MRTSPGAARTLVLVALACAAALLVVSAILLVGGPGASPGDASEDETDEPEDVTVLGAGGTRRASDRRRPDGEDGEGDEGDGIYEPGDPRTPEGEEYWVTPDTLRKVLADRHWEEVLRQLDVMQDEGKTVPRDVVDELLALLAHEGLRPEAIRALAKLRDDTSGQSIAEIAVDPTKPMEVRTAALDALSQSGQKAALSRLQTLVASEAMDPQLARHALRALAAVGGPEGTRTLAAFLTAHREDDYTDAVVTALGRARDADAGLAEVARAARNEGDRELLGLMLKVAQFQGQNAGTELRTEVLRIVESPEALSTIDDEI